MPRTEPPKSIKLLLPSPVASSSSSAPIPSRKVLKAAAVLAKRKRQVLDVASYEAESSKPGRAARPSSKRSSKVLKESEEVEQAETEGSREQTEREKSEASSGYWNHLLIEARRSRGPQWDFSTQIYLVDRGSHLYYSQSHLPEQPAASASTSTSITSQPQVPQIPQQVPQYLPQNQAYPSPNYSAAQQQLAQQQVQLAQQRQQAISAQQQLAQLPNQSPAGYANIAPDQVALYRQQFLQQQQQQALAMQMNGGPPRGSPQSQGQYYPSPPAGPMGNSIYTSTPLRPQQPLPPQMQQGMRPGGMSGMMLSGGGQPNWQQGQGR